jgi:glutathione synthase/RimK-type ligase-like ATP-grasp enzyme
MFERWRVAFITHAGRPTLTDDDRLAIAPLARRAVLVEPATWNDPAVRWEDFDLLVLRSTWDYWHRVPEFRAWLERIHTAALPLWNPPQLALWSLDKRYLRDLELAGVPVLPTRWLQRGDAVPLAQVLEDAGWRRAVIKPVVSANADGAWATSLANAAIDEQRFRNELAARDLMVQCFADAIAGEGEWSLSFMGGAFSHAVIKQPAPGDFRVQADFAGTHRIAQADAMLVDIARRTLEAVPSPWLYARVDLVHAGDGYRVMELEMLEPSLFMAADPERAPERFADAITALLPGGA